VYAQFEDPSFFAEEQLFSSLGRYESYFCEQQWSSISQPKGTVKSSEFNCRSYRGDGNFDDVTSGTFESILSDQVIESPIFNNNVQTNEVTLDEVKNESIVTFSTFRTFSASNAIPLIASLELRGHIGYKIFSPNGNVIPKLQEVSQPMVFQIDSAMSLLSQVAALTIASVCAILTI